MKKLKKADMERICRNAGMRPESRGKIDGHEIFLAEGFSLPPHRKFWRFGVDPTEFKQGCYVGIYWFSQGEDDLDIGRPLIFDLFHNRELTPEGKKIARANAMMKDARMILRGREKARHG